MRELLKSLPQEIEALILDYYHAIQVTNCWLCGLYLVPKLFMFDCFLFPRPLCEKCYLCNMLTPRLRQFPWEGGLLS